MLPRPLAVVAAIAGLVATSSASSASPPAGAYRYSPRTAAGLTRVTPPGGRHVSVVVADAYSARELFTRNPARQRVLASNTKLFVTAAAAARWGDAVAPTLAAILRPSDNALAERLAARLGHGDRRAGVRAAVRFARAIGVRVRLRDAAGLDPANRTTARQLVRFLLAMRWVSGFRAWERALPVAGHSGTLAHRMRGTAADGRCHAKTGTLFLRTLASTLSGYCTTRSGRAVVFSILVGGMAIEAARVLQDRIVARLAAG
jgi:D-alanyl-D-alanine carboxypeptidase/D-alanyl-D-alanine-endopeptidase (penicillin-binding protein 4)